MTCSVPDRRYAARRMAPIPGCAVRFDAVRSVTRQEGFTPPRRLVTRERGWVCSARKSVGLAVSWFTCWSCRWLSRVPLLGRRARRRFRGTSRLSRRTRVGDVIGGSASSSPEFRCGLVHDQLLRRSLQQPVTGSVTASTIAPGSGLLSSGLAFFGITGGGGPPPCPSDVTEAGGFSRSPRCSRIFPVSLRRTVRSRGRSSTMTIPR